MPYTGQFESTDVPTYRLRSDSAEAPATTRQRRRAVRAYRNRWDLAILTLKISLLHTEACCWQAPRKLITGKSKWSFGGSGNQDLSTGESGYEARDSRAALAIGSSRIGKLLTAANDAKTISAYHIQE